MKISIFILLITFSFSAYSTTWDEPWRKEMIQSADYLVKGKIVSASESEFTLKIETCFSGKLGGQIIINDFYMLDLCSSSGGHGPEFTFDKGERGYFLLKKGKKGAYQLPTPTGGFDIIEKESVYTAYRHSYHQALVPKDIFELTYTQIWNYYHDLPVDTTGIMSFINSCLSESPAGFEPDEIDLFFKQHVAIETAYLLDIPLDLKTLKKFATSDNFHANVSAVRAMACVNTDDTRQFLLDYIGNNKNDVFVQVIAVWSFSEIATEEAKNKLWELEDQLSDESAGFGGNIMDPRVCTSLPSPKKAVQALKK